jgi:hypothetical protein
MASAAVFTGLARRPQFEDVLVYENPLLHIPERHAWYIRNSLQVEALTPDWGDVQQQVRNVGTQSDHAGEYTQEELEARRQGVGTSNSTNGNPAMRRAAVADPAARANVERAAQHQGAAMQAGLGHAMADLAAEVMAAEQQATMHRAMAAGFVSARPNPTVEEEVLRQAAGRPHVPVPAADDDETVTGGFQGALNKVQRGSHKFLQAADASGRVVKVLGQTAINVAGAPLVFGYQAVQALNPLARGAFTLADWMNGTGGSSDDHLYRSASPPRQRPSTPPRRRNATPRQRNASAVYDASAQQVFATHQRMEQQAATTQRQRTRAMAFQMVSDPAPVGAASSSSAGTVVGETKPQKQGSHGESSATGGAYG